MSDEPTPGEVVREFYRRSGELRERHRWLTAIAALRETITELKLAHPDDNIVETLVNSNRLVLDNLERLTK
jgi:hypothetical protein